MYDVFVKEFEDGTQVVKIYLDRHFNDTTDAIKEAAKTLEREVIRRETCTDKHTNW